LLTDQDELLRLLEERENLCPTGIGDGIAMPHSRIHDDYLLLDTFLVIAMVPGGVPFGSPDGKLTDLFFMPCAHCDRTHPYMIARLALLLQRTDLADRLRACTSTDEMMETVEQVETAFVESELRK
jgi:mannitol/fructose-specific phosphotransferase system IIA component (Ntr-type)